MTDAQRRFARVPPLVIGHSLVIGYWSLAISGTTALSRMRPSEPRACTPEKLRSTKPLYTAGLESEQSGMPKNLWTFAACWLGFCLVGPGLSAASSTLAQASVPYTIDKWDSEDGLPNNEVLAMTQTRDGYLWLGTLNGLVRFDGIHFEVFDENNTPGLNGSRIVSLFEDGKTNLWIGTETAGVARMKNGRVASPPELGLGGAERHLVAACEESNGAVWLYCANGELWRAGNGSFTRFTNFLQTPYLPGVCRALIAENSGPVWVGGDQFLGAIGPNSVGTAPGSGLRLDPEVRLGKLDFLLASRSGGYWRLAEGRVRKYRTGSVDRERDLGLYPWGRTRVAAACEDREGNLVVGTLGAGLFWFDSEGKATRLSTKEGLSYDYVFSLCVDREGSLWVGTDGGGLNRITRRAFEVLAPSRGLVVQSVCEDDQAGLWMTFNTIGLNTNGVGYWKEGVLQRIALSQGLMNQSFSTVFVDQAQRVWAGTIGAGLFEFQQGAFERVPWSELIHPAILAIHQDRAGRLWLGTRGGLVRWNGVEPTVFTTREGLTSDVIRAIADDAEGNLWVGTEGGGLNSFRDGHFTSFRNQDGHPGQNISSLYVDGESVLWVGTDGSGLGRLHGGKWARYTTQEGLVSNSIGYVIEDGQGYLWIGSNAGLMRAPKKAMNDFANGSTNSIPFRAYGKPEGLPTRECTRSFQPGGCRTRDGKLWFPTIKGLASINPAQLRLNTNPPPVLIESVLIEGQAQNPGGLRAARPQAVIIPAGQERLEIHYTSLNLAAPERARFKYRLERHETAWTEAGNIRVAYYTKLPPGRYRFQVKACNEDGLWNEAGSSVALTVEPPFWQTWWFLGAAALSVLGTIIGVVHYLSTQRLQRQLERLRQQEALEKERARIARDIHDQLGASLTQVALLGEFVESDKDSPADVEAHARQISQTARDTTRVLDEIVWTVNPSNDTLDGLITYICKYAQDYLAVAGLRYRLDVPAQLPPASILPEVRHNVFLAAKEAITNVVRHARASSVWIRLRLEPNAFILEIEDNGRGVASLDANAAQTRNGLRNMRKRMEDSSGSFTITPAPEGGTLVRLTAPLGRIST